jgi:hypothetical protein
MASSSYVIQFHAQHLELPESLNVLARRDLNALNYLCLMHNVLQDHVTRTEKNYHQVLSEATSYERNMAEAVRQLQKLRHHVQECFRLALEAIAADDPPFSGEVIYVPKSLRKSDKFF